MTQDVITQHPKILSVGTSVPAKKYKQLEIAKLLKIENEKCLRFFQHNHIETRHLSDFDEVAENNNLGLINKFKVNAVKLSEEAILRAIDRIGIQAQEIDYICCVTSTGFIVPSLSLLICEKMNFRNNCKRSDLVGMGCSAGLNGLETVSNWCYSNPGKFGLLVCCEIGSAAYTKELSEENALVNSLFGDGVAAAIVGYKTATDKGPEILKFNSFRVSRTLEYLKYNWNDELNLYQFFVSKETPKILGQNICEAISRSLEGKITQEQIQHWIFHTGGAAILDNIVSALNIDNDKIRYTRQILNNYGNLSSASFLFTYEIIKTKQEAKSNDIGMMVTMGPGLAIETALLKW